VLTGRRNAAVPVTSRPPIEIVPDVGCSSPATMRSVVVLPQPDGPSSAKKDPSGTVRSRDSTAVKAPNSLRTPHSSRLALPRGALMPR
jgi:hypothetical protein